MKLADRLQSMSLRDRRAMIVIAVALAVLILAYVVMPLIDNWGATRDQINASRNQLVLIAGKLEKWRTIRDRLRPVYGQAIDAPLPSAADVSIHFAKTLQDALQSGGVEIESIRPQPMRSIKDIQGVSLATFQVTGKCRAEQVPQFLSALTNAPTLIIVERLSSETDQRNGGGLSLNMVLATLVREGRSP